MKKIFTGALLLLLGSFAQNASAQGDSRVLSENTPKSDSVTTIDNVEYDKASKFKRILFGHHYRKVWATPVELPVLFLDSVFGGLKPVKLGGGKQTSSLRLVAPDGKEYVLRSVNKDPSKAIPIELVGTFADDVVQDQISSSNPFAPMVVADLAAAAGIFHTSPEMFYVPQQAILGDFNRIFANTVNLLEVRPGGEARDNAAFGYADKVVNSEKLFEKILNDPDHRMDQRSFLKARLFDMWIGDWDRHEDQWLWAAYKNDGKTIYKPIPRDRDQAFSSMDGIIPQMASKPWAIRKTKDFGYSFKDINGLNMNGAFLDRSFTTELNETDWVEIAMELQNKLTDAAIETSFEKMPKPVYELSAAKTIEKLKLRRKELVEIARDYYRFISKEVNVVGTAKKEYFEVKREGSNSTRVRVFHIKKDGQEKIYERVFDGDTKEIRLYGLDGDDKFQISGDVSKSVLVRVIGGNGDDKLEDISTVKGWSHKTKVYDDGMAVDKKGSESKSFISSDTLKNNYDRKGFRYDWISPQITPGYNPDDGLYIGGGIVIKKQRFGKEPFSSFHSIRGNYAFATGGYNFWYDASFREAVGRFDLNFNAAVKGPNYAFNYFGLGNETTSEKEDKDFYRVRSDEVIITPSLSRRIGKHTIRFGAGYQWIKIENTDGRIVTDSHSGIDSSAFERHQYASLVAGYQYNSTDHVLYPRKGLRFTTEMEFFQNAKYGDKQFAKLSSDFVVFASQGALTAAFRVGAATNIGNDYEFFQANTIGGGSNLRGYRRSRFAGKTSLYQNTELRWKLQTMKGYILRGNWGLLGFVDNGRVWTPGENSNKWHVGYGGGIWFLPYNRVSFTATYGVSKEDQIVSLKAGFMF